MVEAESLLRLMHENAKERSRGLVLGWKLPVQQRLREMQECMQIYAVLGCGQRRRKQSVEWTFVLVPDAKCFGVLEFKVDQGVR